MPHSPIRRTKIVATLGPSWDQPAQMAALLDAGVNVVRINASHGSPEIRARWIGSLREVLASRRDSAAILLDLQGPRIRIGDLAAPFRLESGQRVVFTRRKRSESSASDTFTLNGRMSGSCASTSWMTSVSVPVMACSLR